MTGQVWDLQDPHIYNAKLGPPREVRIVNRSAMFVQYQPVSGGRIRTKEVEDFLLRYRER